MTWETKPLGSVVEVLDGKRIPVKASDRAARQGDVPYYGATGQAGWIDEPIFNESLVLLGEDGAPFFDPYKPKAYFVDGPAWVNNHAHVLRATGVDRRYLKHYLDQFNYEGFANGTTRLKLTQGAMKRIPLRFPKQEEQRRIVELVEEHLSHLDAADAALATSKERANKLWGVTASQLLSRADHSLTPLRELLREPMRNGRSDRASANGEGIRCLTLTAVTRQEFSDRWTKIAATAERTAAGLWLEPGDIFVQRSNTPELVGTSALYEGERHWAIFPDLLIRVRPDENRVDRHFLAAALRSEACHRQLRKSAKGLAGSMPKIDQSALGRLPIPVPAMEQQKAIASQLMELEIDVRRMAHAVEAQSARCATLRRAVLAAAFSGRLTGSSSDAETIEETAAALPSPVQETLL